MVGERTGPGPDGRNAPSRSPALMSLLQCPRCRRGSLAEGQGGLQCAQCQTRFPSVGGLPWLLPEPALALGGWRNRLTLYLDEFAAAERAARADLVLAVRPSTRRRVEALAEAYHRQAAAVRSLLAALMLQALPLSHATSLAFDTRLPLAQDLHSYYTNLHRDWCWGDAENVAMHQLVVDLQGPARARVLVLGAGGCRLAYDLHRHGVQPLTVALDINPLLLLAAERILQGERVELYEFPIAPLTASDAAVARSLSAPAPVRTGLELVFADAFQAPFAPQSFDLVITPWLIDIVEEEPAALAAAMNRLLAPGGRWVNVGSLALPWRRPALRPGPQELLELVREAGFAVAGERDAELPYMRSPASRHARLERVHAFAADKLRRSAQEAQATGRPGWLQDSSAPVPSTEQVQLNAEAARIRAILLALVDGRRSVDELVRIVTEQRLLPADQAVSAVRQLLEGLHELERRGRSPS